MKPPRNNAICGWQQRLKGLQVADLVDRIGWDGRVEFRPDPRMDPNDYERWDPGEFEEMTLQEAVEKAEQGLIGEIVPLNGDPWIRSQDIRPLAGRPDYPRRAQP